MRLFIALWLLSFVGHAQEYTARRYSLKEGFTKMPSGELLEDGLGYLWIGSFGDGLFRFDGKNFINYTERDGLPNSIITGLAQDGLGNIWIGTTKGLSKFNGKEFTSFNLDTSESSSNVSQLTMAKDSLFFLTQGGRLGKIYDDSIYYWGKQIGVVGSKISRLMADRKGNLIFVLSSGEIYKNYKQIIYRKVFSQVYKIIQFGQQDLLSTDKGLFVITDTEIKQIFPQISTRTAYFDERDSTFWIAPPFGLGRMQFQKGRLQSFVPFENRDWVIRVVRDSQGSLWCGTFENGLIQIVRNDFVKRTINSIVDSSSLRAIFRDDRDNLWVGSLGKGVNIISPRGRTTTLQSEISKQNVVMAITGNGDGDVYIGTLGGLLIHNILSGNSKWLTKKSGLMSDSILSLEIGPDSTLYIGSDSKWLSKYKHGKLKIEEVNLIESIYSIRAPSTGKGLYLVGRGGVFFKNGENLDRLTLPGFEDAHIINCNLSGDSVLLLGTLGSGLVAKNLLDGRIHRLTKQNGLLSNNTSFAAMDETGYLWIGTDKGINQVKLTKQFEISEIYSYNESNGYEGVKARENSYLLEDSIKLFGSAQGLYKFVGMPNRKTVKSKLHFTRIEFIPNGAVGPSNTTTGYFADPMHSAFPTGKNRLKIYFHQVDKINPEGIRYSSILENYETNWSDLTGTDNVDYGNLPAGTYLLKVRSFSNGQSSGDVVNYQFSVVAPIYLRTWFLAVIALSFSLLTVFWIYYRTNQRIKGAIVLEQLRINEQERIKKEIARDYHDELGNKLARIINYSNTIRYTKVVDEVILTKMEQTAKSLHFGAKDFIWTIDPANDELTNLFLYIRDFGERMFADSEVAFRAFNKVGDEIHLRHGLSREIVLIFKEALTNVYSHSRAQNVLFRLVRKTDNHFEISLRDDGVGFNIETVEELSGLTNMTVRAKRISSLLEISSKPCAGTEILLKLEI